MRYPEEQYYDVKSPVGPRMTSTDFLAHIGATTTERDLVREATQATLTYRAHYTSDDDMERSGYQGRTAHAILKAAHVPWRRQVTLMCAVLRACHEHGAFPASERLTRAERAA